MANQPGSRLQNSIRNLNFGVISQILISILKFASRSVFIYVLGEEFLGVNGLYTSILEVLSLTELGLSYVVTYSLYKPLAENDIEKLSALMTFYKTVYRYIALAVAIIGLSLVPFLNVLVKSDIDHFYLVLYYLMFLANAVCSYLLVYKSSIIDADQKQYLISKYTVIFKLLTTILQILCLLVFRNFTLYLAIQILMTIGNNYYVSHRADALYPFIREKRELPREEKKRIFADVRHMFAYRAGGSLLNGTDNLYISSMISTATVGLYDNYAMISMMITGYVNIVNSAIVSSIGNLNTSDDTRLKKEIFDVISMIFTWLATFCAVSLLVLSNDFVGILAGERFVLPFATVVVIVVNFYLPVILQPIWNYRNTTGLFRETRNILLYAAGLNIVLSYVLGRIWGLTGILAATSVSRVLTSFWFEPYMLYKRIFQASCWEYFRRQLVHGGVIVLSAALITLPLRNVGINVYALFLIKMILCALVPNGIMLALNFRKPEFQYVWNIAKEKLHLA